MTSFATRDLIIVIPFGVLRWSPPQAAARPCGPEGDQPPCDKFDTSTVVILGIGLHLAGLSDGNVGLFFS
uniref:Secreted protein n=1 Tax=Angiostrongylus cantonensis TaxID=6313 RepID=A0A0K0DEJ6_ANGCA